MAELISDTQTRILQVIAEANPLADTSPGSVLNELVVKLTATAINLVDNDIITLGQADSIESALASAMATTNPVIDEIASNYNVVRNQGLLSTGVIQVVVPGAKTYFINNSFTFTQPALSLTYGLSQAYNSYKVTITPNPTDASQIQLISNNGQYYFLLPVIAAAAGTQYQVQNGTQFTTSDSTTISDLVTATAYGNFTSGQAPETDQQLIARFQTGLTNETLLTKASISAQLGKLYTNFQDISLIGANDAEMTRSKQNLFGISTLGMVDAYVRTSMGVDTVTITKTATLENDGLWHFTMDYTDVPGFYRIISILPQGSIASGSLLFTPTYNYSTTNIPRINVITSLADARFTKYQTCDVGVQYSALPTVSSVTFSVLVSYQPNIGDIQDLFLSDSSKIACADYLVKGAVPCYVSVNLTVHQKPNVTVPIANIIQDIFNYVNSTKFGDSLYVSEIIDICHNYNVRYVDTPIVLTGNIYTNQSTVLTISSNDVLSIPVNPDYLVLGVTAKTTIFIADYFQGTSDNRLSSSITINVV